VRGEHDEEYAKIRGTVLACAEFDQPQGESAGGGDADLADRPGGWRFAEEGEGGVG
jgi:hypothetical protein